MAQKTVEKITFKNFKAFREEQTIDFKSKNVLIYGNNGAGKSSIFWALYTFLQSSIKTQDKVEKYFKYFDNENPDTYQSLRNIFEAEPENSYIDLTIAEGTTKTTKRISEGNIDTIDDEDIKLINATSDFINYKLLSNFYRDSHKYDVNLWHVFERDIFPYLTHRTSGENLFDRVRRITNDVPRTGQGHPTQNGSNRKNNYIAEVDQLNLDIETLISEVQQYANAIIKEHFFDNQDVIRVRLEFDRKFHFNLIKDRIWHEDKVAERQSKLRIKLIVEHFNADTNDWIFIQRVQSLLNEAQLTRVAIAIRIGALRTRIQDSECKILVLDDMLISLDMANRIEVTKMILNKQNKPSLRFFDKFQKIILTHDRAFYNTLRNHTNDNYWEYFNLSKKENSTESPKLRKDRSHIEKAQKFLADGEFDSCGNELRKELESILKNYTDPNFTRDFSPLNERLTSAYTKYTHNERLAFEKIFVKKEIGIELLQKINTDYNTDGTIGDDDKRVLSILERELKTYLINQYKVQNNKDLLFDDLKSILDRILNPASHSSTNPLYEQELEDAIVKILEIKALLTP
ncbi:AAA family ATPase [Flavobacterium microcysteis]